MAREIGAAGEKDSDEAAGKAFLEAVAGICKEVEIPTLAEYGIDRETFFAAIDKMAEDAMASGSPSNTRKEMNREDVAEIYRRLWD